MDTQQPVKILIIDDSAEDRFAYRRYLLQEVEYQYRILEQETGEAGLSLCLQEQPDVILIDFLLPDLDGLEFLSQLQDQIGKNHPPVVMLTGQGDEFVAVQAMKRGAQDYLIKGKTTSEALRLAVKSAIKNARLQQQLQQSQAALEQQLKSERIVTQIAGQIRQSLDLDTILNTTVELVRQFLQTDRVIMFELQPDGNGKVVVESVESGWTPILSTSMYDTCLATSDISSYLQGQATARTDIHNGDIDPCHVNLLAQFQVRANLVVPVLLNVGNNTQELEIDHASSTPQLWGLLIAHECRAPRQWQAMEISLLTQLATQVGIAIQQSQLYQQAQMELLERQQTQQALQVSEERLRLALDAARMGIWDWNILTNQIVWSASLERLFGMEAGEFDGRYETFLNLLHPEDRAQVQKAIARAVEHREPYDIEFRFFCPSGRIRWAVSQGQVFYDQTGRPVRMTGIDLDITARKQAQEALRESEERFRLLSAFAPIGIFQTDGAGHCLYTNPQWQAIAGLSLQESLGDGWARAVHPDDREQVWAEWNRCTQEGSEFSMEFRFLTPQGGTHWVQANAAAIRSQLGEIIGYVGTDQDITARKYAEEALQNALQKLNFHVENSPLGVIEWDSDLRIIRWSESAENIFGWTAQEILGKQMSEWQFIYPEDAAAVSNVVRRILSGDEAQTVCCNRNYAKDGSVVYCEWYNSTLTDESGNLVSVLSLIMDVSERVRLASERDRILQLEQVARSEAERANRVKDEFLAVLSHELRSPLNPILGWSKILKTRKLDANKTTQALEIIERNAQAQAQLIEDLLDVSRILQGKLKLNVSAIDLTTVISSALETVRLAAQAKSIELQPILEVGVWQVSGDATRLQQVFWNFLSNAVKFTPNGGRVEVRLQEVASIAQITVSDTGKGINPEFLPYVFESFRQADSTTTRQFGGLGLGLAIARNIVEMHGGTVMADSLGEGQGATFTVQLPLIQTTKDYGDKKDQGKNFSCAENSSILTGLRVMVVDDEPDSLEFTAFVLDQEGADVIAVSSAEEALRVIQQWQPVLLISDIGMPEMDGYMLIRQIRKLPQDQGGQISAIALTAYASEADCQKALANGFDAHISKPVEPSQLIAVVTKLLKQRV
ncbi:PAS domain-containing protein [Brasilonema octagenarum]|uniref:histidine kinase n=1 Tax=Brasilonema octagenarum UFV-OR1 TaxID=417115 RepID=A0ABX1M8J3_9CYAN|nr:PAS domain-containing protein [Brasilonema octagenarum]NMF63416.1 hybrid sensor histidine kinase/response regulator [Brasilonema octagenarum UFV-OR1]